MPIDQRAKRELQKVASRLDDTARALKRDDAARAGRELDDAVTALKRLIRLL